MPARGLDHLVLGVRNLDAAGAFYEKLGFTVGARNRHPWGTHNRIVQFPGTFLEIITVGEPDLIVEHMPGQFSFGAFIRDALARGEGFLMLVLESTDAVADNAAFHAAGIGHSAPFFFERQAKRPDGSTVRVAFTLSFTANPLAPDQGFFVCEQHEPQNFWNPAFQDHPNGALSVCAATFVSPVPCDHSSFFEAFSGVGQPVINDHGLEFALPRGRIELVTPDFARQAYGHIGKTPILAGFSVAVADLAALQQRLDEQGIAHARCGTRVVVSAFGASIAFEAA
jgi:catechol 2,3-dioxygenase-like lactoylglutathione lyase family enzyme